MIASGSFRLFAIFLSLLTAFSMITIDTAEARRGGSFGSRGTRTFQTVPATKTSPTTTAPLNNTMTSPAARSGTSTVQQPRSGVFGGGLMQGLFFGGLFGLFLGHGFGGFGGMFSLLFQLLLVGGLVWFFFGRRRFAAAGGPSSGGSGYQAGASPYAGQARSSSGKFEASNRDLDIFEQRLNDVQSAYSHEDYNGLRAITTPEMMGYLAAELGENASRGVRNEVLDVKMLGGSVAESWREGSQEFATVAFRYESRDVTRERSSGRIVSGSESLNETTEIWTFVRDRGADWKLSAIQAA